MNKYDVDQRAKVYWPRKRTENAFSINSLMIIYPQVIFYIVCKKGEKEKGGKERRERGREKEWGRTEREKEKMNYMVSII